MRPCVSVRDSRFWSSRILYSRVEQYGDELAGMFRSVLTGAEVDKSNAGIEMTGHAVARRRSSGGGDGWRGECESVWLARPRQGNSCTRRALRVHGWSGSGEMMAEG